MFQICCFSIICQDCWIINVQGVFEKCVEEFFDYSFCFVLVGGLLYQVVCVECIGLCFDCIEIEFDFGFGCSGFQIVMYLGLVFGMFVGEFCFYVIVIGLFFVCDGGVKLIGLLGCFNFDIWYLFQGGILILFVQLVLWVDEISDNVDGDGFVYDCQLGCFVEKCEVWIWFLGGVIIFFCGLYVNGDYEVGMMFIGYLGLDVIRWLC